MLTIQRDDVTARRASYRTVRQTATETLIETLILNWRAIRPRFAGISEELETLSDQPVIGPSVSEAAVDEQS